MKKVIIAVVVLVLILGGGYLVFHKSSKTATTTATTTSNVPAVNNAVVITKTNSSFGQYLTDPSGKALYTYGADTSGVSNCIGSCLAAWPAYQAKGSTSNLPASISTIKRTDNGQIQYTYMGMPLYYFVSDGRGQVTGNGDDNFEVAKPAASTSSQSTSTQPTTPSTSSSTPSNNNSSSGYSY